MAAPVAAANPSFTFGRVLGRSLRIFGENTLAFSVLVLVLHLPGLALTLLAGAPPAAGESRPGYELLSLASGLLNGLLGLVSAGALTHGALRSMAGRRSTPGELLAFGFRSFGTVFVVSLNAGLRIALWSFLLLVPGIAAACRFFVAVPAAVAERAASSSESVERSAALTAGHRFAIFGLLAVFYGISIGASFFLATFTVAGIVPFSALTILVWAVEAVVTGMWATAAGVAYHDLRHEKEGVDTAELAAVFE